MEDLGFHWPARAIRGARPGVELRTEDLGFHWPARAIRGERPGVELRMEDLGFHWPARAIRGARSRFYVFASLRQAMLVCFGSMRERYVPPVAIWASQFRKIVSRKLVARTGKHRAY